MFGCVFQYEQSVGFSLIRRAWEKAIGGCSCQLSPIIALGFRTQLSPAPQMARATPSLTQAAFTSHTGSLLLSLYAPRYCLTASAGFGRQFTKLRALSRLRRRYGSKKVPSPLNFSAASAAAQRRRPGSSRWGWRPKCRPRPRRLRADRPAPRAYPGRSPSAPPTCPAAE